MLRGASKRAVNIFNAFVFVAITMGMGAPALTADRSFCRRFFEIAMQIQRRNTRPYIPPDPVINSVGGIESLKFTTLNVSGFKHERDRYRHNSKGILEKVESGKPKGQAHTNGIASALLGENADVFLIQEAEGRSEAEWFFKEKMADKWKVISIGDSYYHDVVTLVAIRKTLLPHVEVRTRMLGDRVWVDPHRAVQMESQLFHRELQHLMFFLEGSDVPFLHLLNVHLKANFTPESIRIRNAQLDELDRIVSEIYYEFGEFAPLMIGGDFNDNFNNSESLARFRRKTQLANSLDVVRVQDDVKRRTTHVLQRQSGQMVYDQLDALLLSRSLAKLVLSSYTVRYRGENGNPLPLPLSGCEIACLPSPHQPLSVSLNMRPFLR
jgi:hypothetical protein